MVSCSQHGKALATIGADVWHVSAVTLENIYNKPLQNSIINLDATKSHDTVIASCYSRTIKFTTSRNKCHHQVARLNNKYQMNQQNDTPKQHKMTP